MSNAIVSEKEFNRLCNEFNEYYKQVMGQSLDKAVFKNWNSVNKAYKDISKVLNVDWRQHLDAEELKQRDSLLGTIGGIKTELKSILTNSDIDVNYYQIVFPGEENVKTAVRDGKFLLNELKNLRSHFALVVSAYVSEYEDFEREVMFGKESYGVLEAKYNKIVNKLNELLNVEKNIRAKEIDLELLTKSGGEVNKQLLLEFSIKVRESREIGYIEDMYVEYKTKMLKNAFCYVASREVMKDYQDYPQEYFEKILEAMEHEIRRTSSTDAEVIADIATKYSKLIKNRSVVIDYYLTLLKLMLKNRKANFDGIDLEQLKKCDDPKKAKYLYESLKESIVNRIDYYKRVKAKISGFVLRYRDDSFYSYTYPFIVECANSFLDYYEPSDKDLSGLDKKLAELKFVIDERMQKDVRKAVKKKGNLRSRFQSDFENEIFIGDGFKDISSRIDKIKTYGGFANFENNVIGFEMSKVLTSTGIYLRNTGKSFKGKEGGKSMQKLVDRAMILWDQIRVILEGVKNYSQIRISESKVVDYRTLSKILQSLKKIDFYNDNLEQIEHKLVEVDEFLNRDKYDRQLIEMVSSRRGK